jgi:RND family efflux transporter MFP subunit
MFMARKLAMIAVCVLGVACHHKDEAEDDDKPAPAAVTCQAVTAATIDDVVEVTGVIAPPPRLDAVISSPVPGRIAQILVDEGDRVAAGALLAVVEDPALGAGSLEAQAAVDNARAQRAAADQDVARQDHLVGAGIGARKDLDDARAKQAATVAELAAATARAGLAGAQLARREVRAGRAGVVLHVLRKVGEMVDGTAATPIAEVADIRVLELHAQVAPAALRPLRDGMPARVRVLGSEAAIEASVARVAPAVDPTTLLGGVRIVLATSDGIAVGTAASGQIVIAQRPGVRVPAAALRRSLVGEDEIVVCAGGTAHVRTVVVGRRDEQGVEIKDGIKPGEQVVVDHVLGLQDEQPLTKPGAKKEAADDDDKKADAKAKKPADDEDDDKADAKAKKPADDKADDKAAAKAKAPAAARPAGSAAP